ncbi:nucleoside diphosphate kinase, mitochondrial isoform X1 [Perognathus longimembris pacificus]|uniref:nucleoside diphosphate kinase, mitochondrial isoform X1 n=1 Tax=Perognathus longimembris pacificus TaxID=214514 RepID=UPI002019C036|nr:nucleoside diphosphate kinase, mitochondrial isoform X1 [Perognathus longimembris pacificus]
MKGVLGRSALRGLLPSLRVPDSRWLMRPNSELLFRGRYTEAKCAPSLHGNHEKRTCGSPDPSSFKGGSSWTQERTLVALKPDGIQRRLVGAVIQRFERRGFKLVEMKMLQAPESILAEHYQDLQRKPFYPALIIYMSSGPIVAMVWEGYNVVQASRAMIGHTDSTEAASGTIRGDFSIHISRNIIHASNSVEGAQREIQLWFQSSELVNWAEESSHSSSYPA